VDIDGTVAHRRYTDVCSRYLTFDMLVN